MLFLQHIVALLAIALACFLFAKWGGRRLLYLACYAVFIAILSVGYLLEITSPNFSAALVACRIQYLAVPFIAPFFFLFSRDYCDAPVRSRKAVALLLVLPVVFSLLVNTWPQTTLFYTGLSFDTGGLVPHLVVQPGPVYRLAQLYNIALMLSGSGLIIRQYVTAGPAARRDLVVFLASAIFLTASHLLAGLSVAHLGWDPTPLALVLTLLVVVSYIIRFREKSWAITGREKVLENLQDAFILFDTQGRFLDANPAATHLFPQLAHVQPGFPLQDIHQFPAALLLSGTQTQEFTIQLDDEQRFLRASRTPILSGEEEMGASVLLYDVTENHHLVAELQQLATHDALTGLYNRGTFFRHTQRDFALALRKQQSGSILMMDIDHFKKVNDQYGHAAGDAVLVTVAQLLQGRLRQTDIAGRYGGEELTVWLPDAEAEGAAIIADVLRRAVEHQSFTAGKQRFHVTVSIGVAGLSHSRHHSLDALLAEADAALYTAKSSGRNRVCVYSPQQALLQQQQ